MNLKWISAWLPLFLAGCGGSLNLIESDGTTHIGKFDSVTKTLEVDVNGKLYSGHYITNSGMGTVTGWTYGGATPTYTTGQTYYGGNQGRAILRSVDGDTIQCEFSYQGMSAIGQCQDADGKRYQLTTR